MDSDTIIFSLLGAFIAFNLIRVIRQIYKEDRRSIKRDFRKMSSDWRRTKSDFGSLISAYRRSRQSGLGVEDALSTATDEMAGGKSKPLEMRTPPPKTKPAAGFLGVASTVLVNAVSILGVYQFHWPVGTALALYWAENVLTGLVLIATILLWRTHAKNEEQGPSAGEVTLITLVFNAAHLGFLLAFLGVMLPRIAPAERFERHSFALGVAFVAILLMLEFIVSALRIRTTSAAQVQLGVSSYLQRVTVLHLTIIIGMFALALFGQARAFFAVFAGIKMIIDVSRRV